MRLQLKYRNTAQKEGMKTLRQAGIQLALAGDTTIEQIIAATTEL
jgi:type II secretory ATPase GspE/PulE/Tfp pilus assembly ATPase PilB-like protein